MGRMQPTKKACSFGDDKETTRARAVRSPRQRRNTIISRVSARRARVSAPASEDIKVLIRELLQTTDRPVARHIALELTKSGYPVSESVVGREAYRLEIRLYSDHGGRKVGSKDSKPRKKWSPLRDEVIRLFTVENKTPPEIAAALSITRQGVHRLLKEYRRDTEK